MPLRKDLSIEINGVKCENPFFLSSSPVGNNYDMCAKAFEAGWGGIVYKTIGTFVANDVSPRFDNLRSEDDNFLGFRNLEMISDKPLEENLEMMARLKQDYPDKVLVASIMGETEEEWTKLANLVDEAGVDIIECNFSCPHMHKGSLGSDVGQDPEMVKKFVKAVKAGSNLPIWAKMTPNVGHMEIPALAAQQAGADGIAAINTVKSITSVDLDNFAPLPVINGKSSISGYSGKAVKPIALRFIVQLLQHQDFKLPVSGIGGIYTWEDAAHYLLLGARNLQVTTSVMQYGYRIVEDMISGLSHYMDDKGFESLDEMVGLALSNIVSSNKLDRDFIIYPDINEDMCIGCGRCYLSCYDGAYQAI